MTLSPITLLGGDSPRGAYILRIQVEHDLRLAFGRFKGGKLIHLPAGDYSYVGSAMGRGQAALARRLVRHATRTAGQPPHHIRPALIDAFSEGRPDLSLQPTSPKRLHWNVDHLLDQPAAEIIQVIAVRSEARIEAQIGRLLESDPHTSIIEKGLGANDLPSQTHLLHVEAGDDWWYDWVSQLENISQGTHFNRLEDQHLC
jgi:Uri superfamily endonuclease